MLQRPPGLTLFPYTTLFRSSAKATKATKAVEHAAAAPPVSEGPSEEAAAGTPSCPRYRAPAAQGTLREQMLSEISGLAFSPDRKSTRLNSSHSQISYAVFCLNATATTGTYTLSLHDALPIFRQGNQGNQGRRTRRGGAPRERGTVGRSSSGHAELPPLPRPGGAGDAA